MKKYCLLYVQFNPFQKPYTNGYTLYKKVVETDNIYEYVGKIVLTSFHEVFIKAYYETDDNITLEPIILDMSYSSKLGGKNYV